MSCDIFFFLHLRLSVFDVHTAVDQKQLFISYLLIIRDNQTCWWICWNRQQRASHTGSHRGQLCLRRPNHVRVTRSAHRELWRGAQLFRHGSGVKHHYDFHPNQVVAMFSLNKCRSHWFLGVNKQTQQESAGFKLRYRMSFFLRIALISERVMRLILNSVHRRLILSMCPIIFTASWGFFCLIFCVIYLETAKC